MSKNVSWTLFSFGRRKPKNRIQNIIYSKKTNRNRRGDGRTVSHYNLSCHHLDYPDYIRVRRNTNHINLIFYIYRKERTIYGVKITFQNSYSPTSFSVLLDLISANTSESPNSHKPL